jgi:reverse gyrase
MDTSEAMEAAQTLFESGLITYHRTGSTYVSTTGINVAKTYLEENFPGLFRPRHHGEQGAHECTRPTKPLTRRQLELFIQGGMLRLPVKLEKRHLDLYELIFKRFMASQMAAAKVERTAYNIKLHRAGDETGEGYRSNQSRVYDIVSVSEGREAAAHRHPQSC